MTNAPVGGALDGDEMQASPHSVTPTPDILDAALRYAAAGIHVFPVRVTIGPDGKKDAQPIASWREASTVAEATIRAWFGPGGSWADASLAIDCGRSGLVVLDFDGADGIAEGEKLVADTGLSATFRTVTPGGGQHWVYRERPGRAIGNSASKLAPNVDVRGLGGFIFAPPSTDTRGAYRWLEGEPAWAEIPIVTEAFADRHATATGTPNGAAGRQQQHWRDVNRAELDPRDLAALEALEALGGHGAYLSGGYIAITRPGKLTGGSASIGHIGPGLVKVFTGNWPPLIEGDVYDADHLARLAAGDTSGVNFDPPTAPESGEQAPAGTPGTTDSMPAAAARKVRLTPASAITPRPVRWLWADRLPAGEMALTPGRGGVGKSTFHAWLIAMLTRGELPGAYLGTPRACVIATTEDSWDRTVVPRLIAAGADLDLVYRVDVVTLEGAELTLSLPADIDGLGEQLRTIAAVLLSVDPLMGTIASSLDTHKDRDVRQALQPLKRLAEDVGVVVLGNAHFNKSGGTDPVSLVMGSAAFTAVVRAVLAFALDRDDEEHPNSVIVTQAKNNLGRMDLPSLRYVIESATLDTPEGPASVGRVRMLGETDRSVEDVLASGVRPEDREERDEAVRWIRSYLADNGGEAAAVDVYKAGLRDGLSKDQLKRAKKKARVASEKAGIDTGWTWRLDLTNSNADQRDLAEGGAKGAKGVESAPPAPFAPFDKITPSSVTDSDGGPGADQCRSCGQRLLTSVGIERGICTRCLPPTAEGAAA
jgi:hypothetical protein